jgi:hypothetical protein
MSPSGPPILVSRRKRNWRLRGKAFFTALVDGCSRGKPKPAAVVQNKTCDLTSNSDKHRARGRAISRSCRPRPKSTFEFGVSIRWPTTVPVVAPASPPQARSSRLSLDGRILKPVGAGHRSPISARSLVHGAAQRNSPSHCCDCYACRNRANWHRHWQACRQEIGKNGLGPNAAGMARVTKPAGRLARFAPTGLGMLKYSDSIGNYSATKMLS